MIDYRSFRCVVFLTLSILCTSGSLRAEEPLEKRIDRLVQKNFGDVYVGKRSGDAEFCRRLHLDLIGRIPTAKETRKFLADADPQKREKLIDHLLEHPEYARHMSEQFHVLLMERRADHPEWTTFLKTSFEKNLPWSKMAAAMLHPPADDEAQRGAAFFLTARLTKEGAMAEVDVPGLTRDVGRLLAGVDLQCAQCHDHLTIDHYKQKDFQGLHLFFTNITERRDVKFPAVGEKLLAEKADFMSVFDQVPVKTGPVVPGAGELEIPVFKKGEEYLEPPDRKKRTPGVPKFSPLSRLAAQLPSPDNPQFRRHSANLAWFVMMGRGLVHPLDLHHPENPPSHPDVLELLATEWAKHDFNFQWIWRTLAHTETYQRTSILPQNETAPPAEEFSLTLEKPISAETLFWSVITATGELERFQKLKEYQGKTPEQIVAEVKELKKLRDLFVKTFANPPKEPEHKFAPTVKAALLVLNDQTVLDLFTKKDGNLIDRLLQMPNEKQAIEELFLSVFSRRPTAAEVSDISAFLHDHSGNKENAWGQLTWAMIASTEFCVNH